MRKTLLALLVAVLAATGLPAIASTGGPSADEPTCTESSQYGPLRHYCGYFPASTDGTSLAWQVYLPDAKRFGPGPYATVLDYSGYSPASTFYDGLGGTFLEQGYAVAGVNIRGTACSGGTFDYFEPKEWKDGYDAVEFLAARSWSTGDVAMVGKSYPGITQLYVAPMRPPHLRAIVPGAFFSDAYRDVAYPGGIQDAVFTAGFSLASQPGNTLSAYDKNLHEEQDPTCIANQAGHAANPAFNPFVQINSHPYDDKAEYEDRGPYALAKNVQVPVMVQLAWQDEELGARGIDYVNRLPKTTPWRAILTNGDHGEYYDEFNKAEIFRFLALYVKRQVAPDDPCATVVEAPHGNGKGQGKGDKPVARPASLDESVACYQAEPRVMVGFENGPSRTPSWISHFASWPAASSVLRFNAHAGGVLDSKPAGATEPATTYAYTPVVGSNSYGTLQGFNGDAPVDDDFWQRQPPAGTTASFTTAPFTEDTLLAGNASLDMWLSSTAPDTDLEVMVTEIRPGGTKEQYVSKGWLRASHRKLDPSQSTALRPYQTHQLADAAPLVPGQATPVRVEVFPFAQVFRAGTRLRITVEAPNLAPELWGFAALPIPAVNSILTDAAHPTSLALPVVDVPAGTTYPAEIACGTARNQPCRPAR